MIDITQLEDGTCYQIAVTPGLRHPGELLCFAEWRDGMGVDSFRCFNGQMIRPVHVLEVYNVAVDPLPFTTKDDKQKPSKPTE